MIAEIAGVKMDDNSVFYIDFIRRELRDSQNPGNAISIDRMTKSDGGYFFRYDPDIRNIARADELHKEGTYEVCVLNLTSIQPQIMAFLYGVPEDSIAGRTDEEFFNALPDLRARQAALVVEQLDYALWEKRLAGILPEVQIEQERFLVKWESRLMYSLRNPDLKIDFNRLKMEPGGTGYIHFFDLESKIPVYDPLPADYNNLGICVIPDEAYLDPVGVARSRGFHDIDLLAMFPLVERTVVPGINMRTLDILLPDRFRNVRNAIRRAGKRRGKGL